MSYFHRALAPLLFVAATASTPAAAERIDDPLRFFEGRTESVSTVKLIMKKPYRSRAIGHGVIGADGSLTLVQRVEDAGRRPHQRRWRMHKVGPGRFSGTMSEATGPVTVQEIDGRYRFRFKMKHGVSIEQWLTPLPGGKAARNTLSIKKLGIKVGSSDGTIRKRP